MQQSWTLPYPELQEPVEYMFAYRSLEDTPETRHLMNLTYPLSAYYLENNPEMVDEMIPLKEEALARLSAVAGFVLLFEKIE